MYLGGRHIPVFPLPTVVLFPRIPLPLYIHEPRYRMMLSEVLDSHGKIAMALVREQPSPHGGPGSDVFPVMGVGTVMTYDTRPDGTSNIFLVGETRARVIEWEDEQPYPLGVFEELDERDPETSDDADRLRGDLRRWVDRLTREGTVTRDAEMRETIERLQQVFSGERELGFLVDFLAHWFLEDPEHKQELLEELDVEKRARKLHGRLRSRNLV